LTQVGSEITCAEWRGAALGLVLFYLVSRNVTLRF